MDCVNLFYGCFLSINTPIIATATIIATSTATMHIDSGPITSFTFVV